MSNTQYLSRPLAQELRRCRRKVAILEGARAVGKTMMVQRELPDGYHFETLADRQTFLYASRHLESWLSSLPRPCIIDEAQRIADLPLAVKSFVDAEEGSTPAFVLTGSASITRTGLDGQDPLTRRSMRYTLNPMTRREINRNAEVSVVDALWNGEPNANYTTAIGKDDLARYMAVGGFPSYALMPFGSESDLRLAVRADIENVLGDTILPGERLDRTIAESVLNMLLSAPGGILNMKRIADGIHSNPSTVERYISIFIRRFLISALPNLRTAPGRQTFVRAKIHPVDTSFSVEMLRKAGHDFRSDPVLFGEVFESFVINQIVPEAEWSRIHPDAFYWRETGKAPKEVDLVLVHDDELIAVEVKSNTVVNRDDFAGLVALRQKDERFKRGYVIYTGKKTQRFGENMWALPVSALWDGDGFIMDEQKSDTAAGLFGNLIVSSSLAADSGEATAAGDITNVPIDANVFLSYSHADNEHLHDGIVAFMRDVADEYSYTFVNKIQLFVDRDSINWGDDWKQVIGRSIDAANIIIPAITPRYLRSANCRKELLEFNARATGTAANRILPLLVQNIDHLTDIDPNDPVWGIAHSRQRRELDGDLRIMDQTQRRQSAIRLAEDLHTVIQEINDALDERDASANNSKTDTSNGVVVASERTSDMPDLLEAASTIEELTPQVASSCRDFTTALQGITVAMNNNAAPTGGSVSAYQQWADKLAADAQSDVDALRASSQELAELWERTYAAMARYVDFAESLPRGGLRNKYIDDMSLQLNSVVTSLTLPASAKQTLSLLRMVANFMRPLRSMADTTEQSITLVGNMGDMAAALLERLDHMER